MGGHNIAFGAADEEVIMSIAGHVSRAIHAVLPRADEGEAAPLEEIAARLAASRLVIVSRAVFTISFPRRPETKWPPESLLLQRIC